MADPVPASCPELPAFDVLVVGAGAAGLYTALCLPSHLRVGLITKDTLSLSASDWAQGGIAAVTDPEDALDLHITDTLQAGAGLCDYRAVKFLVEQAPACIQQLVGLGVGFDRHQGRLALTLEAAHSRRRVLHAADTTGRAVVSTLTAQVLSRPNIQVLSQGFVVDLWLGEDGQTCHGISLILGDRLHWVAARAVILATGGGGQVFTQTTNPALSTGDGVAIAYRAGALLRDLEFVQFHPTALTKPGAPRFLISEAVRGEGAHLVDRQGHRFAFDYHPAGELAPRDVVSRAIFTHLLKTESDLANANVWLDLRPISPETVRHRFPNIMQVCQQWGIDVFTEPIPVAPAAHYWMGGVMADLENRTTIAQLYAVGETASTGVHGANRLASNSLLECIVYGAQFSHLELPTAALDAAQKLSQAPVTLTIAPDELTVLQILRQEVPRQVWQGAGICREQEGLQRAIAQVAAAQQTFDQLKISQTLTALEPGQSLMLETASHPQFRLWGETRNLLTIATLILKSALFRQESRGGHYRADFPTTVEDWQVHSLVQNDRWWTAKVQAE